MRTLLSEALLVAIMVISSTLGAANGNQAQVNEQILSGVRADKTDYKVGEPVVISFIVENRATEAVTLRFPSALQYDVWAVKDGREVWRWSHGRAFAQMLTSLTVPAGERKTFSISWNQTNDKGEKLTPGAYSIFAQLTTFQPRPTPVKDTIQIAIAPAAIKLTTVIAILENLETSKGDMVQLEGTFLGFRPDPDSPSCRPGPPKTRSDWAFRDATGCIYVTGLYRLDPVRDIGARIYVTGYVRVTNNGQPYIQATGMGIRG